MNVAAFILDGPITPGTEAAAVSDLGWSDGEGTVGARLRFEGIVRRLEEGRAIVAIDYETYDPMAQLGLETLAREVGERHGLASVLVLHSRGRVRVGEVSFVLVLAGAHRTEALAAMTGFIDRMKQDVPIWKRPVWAA